MARKRKSRQDAIDAARGEDDEQAQRSSETKMKGSGKQDEDVHNMKDIESESFDIPFNNKQITCERRNQCTDPSVVRSALLFTHGAGGGLQNPALKEFAEGFSVATPVICFKGNMNLKSRTKAFHAVLEHENTVNALGGRSMGARAAVITATETSRDIAALVLVSYPLIGGTKGEIRDEILLGLPQNVDVLFISGDRDAMCPLERLNEVREKMTASTWLLEVHDADHGMSLSSKNKTGIQKLRRETGRLAANWLTEMDRQKQIASLSWNTEKEVASFSGWNRRSNDTTDSFDEPPVKRRKNPGRVQ